MLFQKNKSADGVFNVFTGRDDIKKYTQIDLFNHQKLLKYWKTDECNRIHGTDGSSYPPNIGKKSKLHMFNKNLCRSLPLIYWHDIEQYGIKGYRSVI